MRRMDSCHRAWAAALVTGTCIWFSPSLLIDGHVWPQWDAWVLPPYLLAALLASMDLWFTTGLVIAVGMMFKGQFLLGAPLLLIWPLARGRFVEALRLGIGFVLMAGLLLSPWTVLAGRAPSAAPQPIWWIGQVLVAAGIGVMLSLFREPARRWVMDQWKTRRMAWRDGRGHLTIAVERGPLDGDAVSAWPLTKVAGLAALITVAVFAPLVLILRPWPRDADVGRGLGVILFLAVMFVPWLLRRRALAFWAAAMASICSRNWSTATGRGKQWALNTARRNLIGWLSARARLPICLPS